jgi:SMODS domain-containing protein
MATMEKAVWLQEGKGELDSLLMEICEELQLSPARYELAVQRYGSVNELLEYPSSPFHSFRPRIYPQGSMALGTTNKPVDGPHDLDFVLQLDAPYWHWKPLALLHALYQFLKSNEKYRDMTTLKNRVVRLTYADDFYMDILPAYTDVVSGGTCILVPDRELVALCHSNPEGYIHWFRNRALSGRRLLMEKAKPVPPQQDPGEKEPLQLSVQLLKRWRDLAFEREELAPISVVLTTLAGMHYRGEESSSETLSTILAGIVSTIDSADLNGQRIEVRNPSNLLEDFGERWDAKPAAYSAFKQGIRQLQKDWSAIVTGRRDMNKELERLFGEYVRTVLVKRAQRLQERRKAGQLAVTSAGIITGLSSGLTRIPQNTFHGDD